VTRRNFLLFGLAAGIPILHLRYAHAQGAVSIIAVIVKAFAEAAASLDKMADGIHKLIADGDRLGLPLTEAKRTRDRLNDILALSGQLVVARSAAIEDLDAYIAVAKRAISQPSSVTQERLESQWRPINERISEILVQTRTLLRDVEKERSSLVRSPVYEQFLSTFNSLVKANEQVANIREAPKSEKDIQELEQLSDSYHRFIASLRSTNEVMAKYLEFVDPSVSKK